MKKTRTVFGIMALAATLWSCSANDESTPAQTPDDMTPPIENGSEPVDTRVAIVLSGKSNTETQKAYLADGLGNVNFAQDEQISVFDGTYNNAFAAKEDGAETDFSGMANLVDTYYILSPYQLNAQYQGGKILATVPSTQKAVENTFDPEACLAVAECKNNGFVLNNIGAIARVETIEPFAKIVLKTAKGESIAGSVSIDPATAAAEITSGQSEIEIVPESGSEIKAGVYYISVLPAALAEGLKFEFVSADNSVKTKTFNKNINIRQSKGINFGAIKNYDASPMTLAKAKTPAEVFEAMGLGWNLGNHCDAYYTGREQGDGWVCGEAYDNVKATQELFNALAAAGIKTVRIPVTWWPHTTWESYKDQIVWVGGSKDGWDYVDKAINDNSKFTGELVIMESWLKRVHEIVGYAKNAGLNAIINIHHDGSEASWWLSIKDAANNATYNEYVKKQIKSFWTQIATEMADEGEYLIFEGFNEIHDGNWNGGNAQQWAILDEWEALFVKTVRDLGGNNAKRWLSVPSYQTTPERALNMNLPNDNRIMVAVHYYANYKFSLEPNNFGIKTWGDYSTNPEMGESYTVETFQKLKNALIDNGIPVYIGEIGCVAMKDDAQYQKYRIYMLEYCSRVFHDFSMSPILWDNGSDGFGNEQHGYFHHGTGAWYNESLSKPVIEAMKLAVESTDPSYTPDYIKNYKNPAKGY